MDLQEPDRGASRATHKSCFDVHCLDITSCHMLSASLVNTAIQSCNEEQSTACMKVSKGGQRCIYLFNCMFLSSEVRIGSL